MKLGVTKIIFLVSTILNAVLTLWFLSRLFRFISRPNSLHSSHSAINNLRNNSHEKPNHAIWPTAMSPQKIWRRKTDRLTNVVMPFHPRQEKTVLENLDLWNTYTPCFSSLDTESAVLGRNITFTFYVSTDRDEQLEARLLSRYEQLPLEVRQCFSEVNFRYSNLTGNRNNYLTGSRKMFEMMLFGELAISQDPRYALYMEPDMRPIRPGWLSKLDRLTRYPNPTFWIKGSVFRGNMHVIHQRILYNLLHINGNAIYNLGDPGLQEYYADYVRPYVASHWTDGAYDTDIYKFLTDETNFNFARRWAHYFQFTDMVRNLWHTEYSANKLREESNQVVIVHGGTPRP